MKKLLDFDLEIALKERERVICADGTKVDDWYYFKTTGNDYPIVAQISNSIRQYTKKGEYIENLTSKTCDLKLLPKTKTWWFCVYQRGSGSLFTSTPYEDKGVMQLVLGGDKDVTILQEYTYTEELP